MSDLSNRPVPVLGSPQSGFPHTINTPIAYILPTDRDTPHFPHLISDCWPTFLSSDSCHLSQLGGAIPLSIAEDDKLLIEKLTKANVDIPPLGSEDVFESGPKARLTATIKEEQENDLGDVAFVLQALREDTGRLTPIFVYDSNDDEDFSNARSSPPSTAAASSLFEKVPGSLTSGTTPLPCS